VQLDIQRIQTPNALGVVVVSFNGALGQSSRIRPGGRTDLLRGLTWLAVARPGARPQSSQGAAPCVPVCRQARKPPTSTPRNQETHALGATPLRGLAPALAIPASLAACSSSVSALAARGVSPRGIPSCRIPRPPRSPSFSRDRSHVLRCVKARGAVSVASLHPAPHPALESLTQLRPCLL
jgi:hypothetical protein